MSDAETKEASGGNGSIDPALVAEMKNAFSEEDIVGEYISEGSGEEKIPMAEKWFPGEKDWGGKSFFKPGQPEALSLADNLTDAFPIILPMKDFINNFISDYEERLTSLEGLSREQQKEVLISVFGGNNAAQGDSASALEIMLSPGPEDKD